MDKKQVLEEGIELWTVLAETGEKNKLGVPGPWQSYLHMCPCCEYTREQFGQPLKCRYCPIVWYGDNRGLNRDHSTYLCCKDGSPYRAWLDAEDVECLKFWAQEVVDLHKKVLKVFLTSQVVGTIL